VSEKLRELVQGVLASEERVAVERFARMVFAELPTYAHDWNQTTGICRKCQMNWEQYYRFDRPICPKLETTGGDETTCAEEGSEPPVELP